MNDLVVLLDTSERITSEVSSMGLFLLGLCHKGSFDIRGFGTSPSEMWTVPKNDFESLKRALLSIGLSGGNTNLDPILDWAQEQRYSDIIVLIDGKVFSQREIVPVSWVLVSDGITSKPPELKNHLGVYMLTPGQEELLGEMTRETLTHTSNDYIDELSH